MLCGSHSAEIDVITLIVVRTRLYFPNVSSSNRYVRINTAKKDNNPPDILAIPCIIMSLLYPLFSI